MFILFLICFFCLYDILSDLFFDFGIAFKFYIFVPTFKIIT